MNAAENEAQDTYHSVIGYHSNGHQAVPTLESSLEGKYRGLFAIYALVTS